MASSEIALVDYVREHGYHPRTSRHSDFQSSLILKDLIERCPSIASRATSGEIVARLRHHQQVGHDDWVIDIAIGTAAIDNGAPARPDDRWSLPIRQSSPVIIQIAIELKSIWTEHGKARKNRMRDLNSFHSYAHRYDPRTVAAGFLVVNASEYFWSPLRPTHDVTRHGGKNRNARTLARETVGMFRSIHLRGNHDDVPGMEALGVIVIEHDNLMLNPEAANHEAIRRPTQLAPSPPNPPVGDPLNYQTMIQRICNAYTLRFG
jgi:hypothetical protein